MVTSGPRYDVIQSVVTWSQCPGQLKQVDTALMVTDNYQLNFQLCWDTGQGLGLIYVFPDPEENLGNPFLLMFTRVDICLLVARLSPGPPLSSYLGCNLAIKSVESCL